MGFVVDELFAFIAVSEDGDEGVIGAQIGDMVVPLVAADLVRAQQYVPLAEAATKAAGITYRLKHFQLTGDVSDEYLSQFKELQDAKFDGRKPT